MVQVDDCDPDTHNHSAVFIAMETPKSTTEPHNQLESQFTQMAATKEEVTPEPSTNGQVTTFKELFAYADALDYLLMFFGTIASMATGVSQPIQIILFGDILNSFNPRERNEDSGTFSNLIDVVALRYVYVGIAVIICGFVYVYCWTLTATRQVKRIRSAYVTAIITKDIGWFDVNKSTELATRVSDSTVVIQEGIGRKFGDGINFMSMAISGIIIGLVKGWELALVLIAFTPFIAAAGYFFMKQLAQATRSAIDSYSKAGSIAEEAIINVRTVHAFNAMDRFIGKYADALKETTKAGIKKGVAVGMGTGIMFFCIFSTYACGMYYGAVRISNDQLEGNSCTGSNCYNGGKVLTIFFSVIMSAMALGQSGPSIQAVFSARAAAFGVFKVIDRPSEIDVLKEVGQKLENVKGKIDINNVTFAYPSRPEVCVCREYSLTIHPGETIALVGPSGSGKSTIVAILERFYDPLQGNVALDGQNLKDLNVKWLRQQIGLVGQEPSLFATSIMENIRLGFPSASDEQVLEAAKMANAFDFIMEFPQGFNTEVGERGAQLSGGQKQRIAIARAIIKNPPILLLDEATSALDSESERVVQDSLDRLLATSQRTTIIIAHRLSTIRDANRIAVHSSGSIVELGSHSELMKIENGHYRTLVAAQERKSKEEKEQLTVPEPFSSELVLTKERSDHSKEMGMQHSPVTTLSESSNNVDVEILPSVSTSRIWKLTLLEWKHLVLGSAGGIVYAAVFPIWGLMLTKVVVLFFDYEKTKSEMRYDARWWSLGFLLLGIIFGVSATCQQYGYGVVAQRLVGRMRLSTFSSILQQEIGWFDAEENKSGALISRLATDTATLQAMTSDTLNQVLVSIASIGLGITISFFYSWQMTLVVLATMPILIFSSLIQSKMLRGTGSEKKGNDGDSSAGSLLSEAIGSIRTVASFTMEESLTSRYSGYLSASKKADAKAGFVGGLAYGMSQGIHFMNLALIFHVGGVWVSRGTISFENMFMVMMVIMLSTYAVGMASNSSSDPKKVKIAAARIFGIIDRKPVIIVDPLAGEVLEQLHGDIEFNNVVFTYPSRPDALIYRNYNLKVTRGQTVALVGASGSGKSTAISLLERFYDPSSGSILLDGKDVRQMNLPWLRERISLVGQEPVLFAGTIADNIAMGKPGASRDDVIRAATLANAHNFISNFPSNYDTDVGDRGAQVSGGQKQRIAIARAILRDPDVLLLDEATSALDNESERVVQKSLDRLMSTKRRTTIIVAHRLSTIRNADFIAVTQNGAIVERGTHEELMEIPGGIYRSLAQRQMRAPE
uniref:Uncharacterized protein AlNc14C35G3135 n=1 Tax=Albugo laibachii Nc14 TaxID=890382 RepID=F0W8K9_9STRA|nr:hypothetical protein OsI_03383 [Albugo laibachii Nc14]|eukprot:CCA17464.1 hypothetical protein OsI_03383 [Albugo laibachii Nc14]